MKNATIAVVVIVVLGLLYWWWQMGQSKPSPQTAQEKALLEGEVSGAVTSPTWEATGKDGEADTPN
jgi:multidrug resistance efflux pump